MAAQSLSGEDNTLIEGGVGIGTATQLKVGVNHIFRTHHLISVHVAGYINRADNVPLGYSSGMLWTIRPKEYHLMLSALYGNVLKLSTRTRISAKAGATAGCHSYPDNFISYTSAGMIYSSTEWFYDRKTEPVFGAVINPSLELLFNGNWGLSAGFYANINTSRTITGFELNVLLAASDE